MFCVAVSSFLRFRRLYLQSVEEYVVRTCADHAEQPLYCRHFRLLRWFIQPATRWIKFTTPQEADVSQPQHCSQLIQRCLLKSISFQTPVHHSSTYSTILLPSTGDEPLFSSPVTHVIDSPCTCIYSGECIYMWTQLDHGESLRGNKSFGRHLLHHGLNLRESEGCQGVVHCLDGFSFFPFNSRSNILWRPNH